MQTIYKNYATLEESENSKKHNTASLNLTAVEESSREIKDKQNNNYTHDLNT